MPRILGDVISLVLASTLTYFVNSYILEEKELQLYSSATMSVRQFVFNVNVMAV